MKNRKAVAFPLPNEFLSSGDMCPKSFAGEPENHSEPHDVERYGVCVSCGEVVRIDMQFIPEHRIP